MIAPGRHVLLELQAILPGAPLSIWRHHPASAGVSCFAVGSASQAAISALQAAAGIGDDGHVDGTFLLMTWTDRCRCGSSASPGENAFSRPVTRSSNRAPTFSMTSQPCMVEVRLVPCRASPACRGIADRLDGIGAQAHQRAGAGKAGAGGRTFHQRRRRRTSPALMTPPPV